jgi:hypothetical protein
MTDTTTRRTGPAAIRTGEILTGAFHLTEGGSGSGFPARSLADLLDLMRRSHYPIALSALVHDQEWPRDVPEGWQAGPEAQGWQSYTLLDDTRVVAHVGTVSELDPHRHPYVYSGSSALLTWGRAFGVPYHGTPGVAGTDVLRAAIGVHRTEVIYRPDKRRDWVPDLERLARVGLERDYVPTDWCATGPLRDEPTITLDANMAYLAAALAPFGRVTRVDGNSAEIEIPRREVSRSLERLLAQFPVVDLSIEELPIEEIVRRVFLSAGAQNPPPLFSDGTPPASEKAREQERSAP